MPIPNAQGEPTRPPEDPKLWDHCPDCHGSGYEILMGKKSRWSMEQVCMSCGLIGPDLHFTAKDDEK